MTYTAYQVFRVLPSVFDQQGFYERGGKHVPEEISEDEARVQGSSDPTTSMDALCELLDVRKGLHKSLDTDKIAANEYWLLWDVVTSPHEVMREVYGEDYYGQVHAVCKVVAENC